jgi:aminoglycoside phosphotransferase (APT) family kinase protein
MKRLPGRALGDFTGFQLVTHEILDDLAKALAKIHSIDIGALTINGQDRDRSQEDRMQKKIASQWQQWRSNTVEQSPLIEYTFGWLQRECRTGLNPPVLVHGDIRPHNLLGENGRLTGILDWELAHIGDPVEDLAYLRPVIHTLGHWPQFMEVYRKHGGGEFDERLFRIYGAWGLVRNASFGARSARLHLNDEDPDFTRGAVGYYSIPMLEAQLAEVLDSHILGK